MGGGAYFIFLQHSFPIQVSLSTIGGELLLLHSGKTLENLKTYSDPRGKKKRGVVEGGLRDPDF